MKKLSTCLSLLLLTCTPIFGFSPSPLTTQSTPSTLEGKTVSSIRVQMENLPAGESFDPSQILTKLKTTKGAPFSQATFDGDLKTLSEEFDRVQPRVELQQGQVQITLLLWRKPPISSIEWSGNNLISTKTLNKELGIKKGSIFDRQSFNKAFNKVREFYIKKGYFESQLQYKVLPDPETGKVKILIDVDEGRSGKIADLVFVNFTPQEESQILEQIYTKKHNLFLSWLNGTGVYNEEAVEQDKLTITNLLQNEGYADARVEISPLPTDYEGWILLQVKADRGHLYHVGEISFEGNILFTNEELDKQLLIHPGDPYSPEKLRETQQAIKELYGRKGHIEANIQYETELVPGEQLYNIRLSISEGEEYKIGLIHIFGNTQTSANVILRESLLVPGETFDSAKLKYTEARLMNVGYFKSVNVYAVRSKDDVAMGENYRDVYIEVEETTTGNVGLFFGLSSADSIFGGLDIAESNFNIKGFGKFFAEGPSVLRGGGEYLHARVNIGAKQLSYTLSWLDPYFRDSLWRLGVDGNYMTTDIINDDYHQKILTFTVNAGYPLARYLTFNTKYRIRNSLIGLSSSLKRPVEVTTPEGGTKTIKNLNAKEVNAEGLISIVGMSLNYDSSDHPIKPHNGFRSLLEGEFAGVGGDVDFGRINFTNTFYYGLWKRGILKFRADLHFLFPFWQTPSAFEIPLSERFFLGGETTVRGYRAFSIGPRDGDTDDPTGGITASLFSAEYLQEIFPFLDGFVFVDGGMVSIRRCRFETYLWTAGFGARVDIMNRMPFIVGIGFPLNRHKDLGKVQKFYFSMGGQF